MPDHLPLTPAELAAAEERAAKARWQPEDGPRGREWYPPDDCDIERSAADVPRLIATVRALQAENERLREEPRDGTEKNPTGRPQPAAGP